MTRDGDAPPPSPGAEPTLSAGRAPPGDARRVAPAQTLPSNPVSARDLAESADTLAAPGDVEAPPLPLVGDILGDRYQLLEELGRGGEGVVFRALDLRADTVVALKLLEQGMGSSARLARFRRELAMARKVTHRGVVRIYDLVELPGRFALSMELVEGEPLDHRLERRPPLDAAEIVQLACDLAQALAAAHEAGVTHRDLKPANVLLRAETGHAVITDFGVSRLHASTAEPASSARAADSLHLKLTQEGALVGTPQYMAPEQLEGSADVGPRADVYAFGLVLFEAATGRRAHEGRTLFELRERRRDQPVPSLGDERPDLPARLCGAIDRALAHDPGARFASGRELAYALEPLSPGVRVHRSIAPKSARRARSPLVAAAIVVVGMAAIATLVATRRAPTAAVSASSSASAAASSWPAAFRAKRPRKLAAETLCAEYPTFTPDAKHIVYDATVGPDSFVMIRDVATGATKQLTRVRGWDYAPAVSPDGKTVAFLRATDDSTGTYIVDIHGDTPPRFVAAGSVRPSFSPDGSALWAGDRVHPTRYRLSDLSPERSLPGPPGYLGLLVLELAEKRVVVAFPRLPTSPNGGLAVYGADDTLTWIYRGDIGAVLALAPDGLHALFIRGTDSVSELAAVPLAGGPAVSMSESGFVPRTGLQIAADRSAITWSTCTAQNGLARIEGDGKLVDLEDSVEDAASIHGKRKLVVVTIANGVSQARIEDRNGGAPVAISLGDKPYQVSADKAGTAVTGILGNKGVFVAPLAEGGAPRWLTHAETDGNPTFRASGREVIFARELPEGDSQILAVPTSGGTTRVLVPTEATEPAASPVDDRIVFLSGRETKMRRPMLFDLKSNARSPLSQKLPAGDYAFPSYSEDGKRVALLRGGRTMIEVDVKTGAIVREADFGTSSIHRLIYSGSDILVLRTQWIGDLWVADGPI